MKRLAVIGGGPAGLMAADMSVATGSAITRQPSASSACR